MDRHEKTILGFTGGSHFFTHFYMLIFPALLLPISRELGLPLSETVEISFIMYLLYGLMAAPWGFLSDRWSHKGVLSAGIAMAGLGTLLAGVSASISAGSGFLTASFALTGIGCSAFHPAGTALVSQGIEERGKALGINGVFGNIGIAAAPISAGVLNYALGWQTALIILGGLGILLGIGSSIAPIGIARGSDKLVVEKMEQKSAIKFFVVFAAAMTFSGLMYRAFTTVLPAFLELRIGNLSQTLREAVRQGGSASSAAGTGQPAGNPALDTLIANAVTTGVYVIGIIGQLFGVGSLSVKLISWVQERTGSLDSVMWLIILFLGIIICIASVFLLLSRGTSIRHGKKS